MKGAILNRLPIDEFSSQKARLASPGKHQSTCVGYLCVLHQLLIEIL